MTQTYFVRDLLVTEVSLELSKTRRLFEALPEGQSAFKPYAKSMTLGRLAGHIADILTRGPNILFTGDRFTCFRNQAINQMVHHRAQLGTYLRVLGLPLPGMYGPSADGI